MLLKEFKIRRRPEVESGNVTKLFRIGNLTDVLSESELKKVVAGYGDDDDDEEYEKDMVEYNACKYTCNDSDGNVQAYGYTQIPSFTTLDAMKVCQKLGGYSTTVTAGCYP